MICRTCMFYADIFSTMVSEILAWVVVVKYELEKIDRLYW